MIDSAVMLHMGYIFNVLKNYMYLYTIWSLFGYNFHK